MKHITRQLLLPLVLNLACLSCLPLPAHAALDLSKDIDKQMAECLNEVEYRDYMRKMDDFRSMRDPKNVKISDKYKLTDVVKDDKGKAICDLPGLPTWVTAFCYTRKLTDFCETERKAALREELGRLYAKYIRRHLIYYDQGNDRVPTEGLEDIGFDSDLKPEAKKLKQIEDMFKKGVVAYYIKMRDLEKKILVYRDRCMEVPNLVGMTYKEGTDKSLEKKRFGIPMIQQDCFKNLPLAKREPLIINKQFPEPGAWRSRGFNIEVWVRNDLKSLKANPPLWHGAKVGDAKSFVVTAELLNGKKIATKDQDCKWHTTDTNVVKALPTKGNAIATGPGKAEIRVLYDHHDGVKLASHVVRIPVTVLAPIPVPVSLKAVPASWIFELGNKKTFSIIATLSDSNTITVTKDCTWSTSSVVKVVGASQPPSTFLAIKEGDAVMTAEYRISLPGAKPVKVDIPISVVGPPPPPAPISLKASPASWDTVPDKEQKFVMIATLADGNTIDVTDDCTWNIPTRTNIVKMKDLLKFPGLAKAVSPGKTTINVAYDSGISGAKPVKISIPVIVRAGASGYIKLTLSKTDIVMDQQSTEPIKATAYLSNIPQFILKDVTFDPDITWTSSDLSIAEFDKGVIHSKSVASTCVITATFNPPGISKPLVATCKVTVKSEPIIIDFSVTPKTGPYMPGEELLFWEEVKVHDKSKYILNWYVEDRECIGKTWVRHTFDEPGKYTVRLVAKHRKTGVEKTIAKSITIEQPPDVEVRIGFSPETNMYKIGSTVGFIAVTKNDNPVTEYRWYVSGEYIGEGKTGVSHKFKEEGEYEIKLGLRMESNFDEQNVIRTLRVGKAGIGVLGTWINRFKAVGGPDNLEIQSQYWVGGDGEWSELISFNRGHIGEVDHHIFYTGKQAGTYNTGFLVYVPRNLNRISFATFEFRWPANSMDLSPRGVESYSGWLDLHNKTIIPDSVTFTRKASRLCEIEWRTKDGSSCRARIWKTQGSSTIGTITQSTFIKGGVDDLDCKEGVYPPIEDRVDTPPDPDVTEDEIIEEDEPEATLAERLVSGTYRVEAQVGQMYTSPWTLSILNGDITGTSKWTCCPAPRTDSLKGHINGNTVVITRDCTGQGWIGACSQKYTGTLNGDVIEGSFTLNERQNFGTWTLYLNSREDSTLTDSSQTTTGTQTGDSENNDSDNENGGETDSEDSTLGGGGPGSGITDLEGTPDGGSGGILLPDGSTGPGTAGGGDSGGGLTDGPGTTGSGSTGSRALGNRWDITEVYGWTGVWTRRGNSNIFDAHWTNGGKQEKAVLSISINGNTVTVKRKQSAGSSYPGQNCTYNGTLAADNRTVTGTYGCDWAAGPYTWSAIIRRGNGGGISPPPAALPTKEWRECETSKYGKFCGTWTFLDDNTIDARWDNGAKATLTLVEYNGKNITVRRSDASDSTSSGLSAIYTGTVSGQTASGSFNVVHGDNKFDGTWTATWDSEIPSETSPPNSLVITGVGTRSD